MLISRLTPRTTHATLKRYLLKKSERVFHTYYRANTVTALRRLAANSGFVLERLERAGNPEYLGFLKPLATSSVLFERAIAHWALQWLQMYLVVVFRKPEEKK